LLENVEAIELNLSCPNVDEAADSAAAIVSACRVATALPLYPKLSAAHPDVASVARAVADAGADGLSLVNTLRGLALDPKTLEPVLGRGTGGLSGPSLKPVALAAVYACYAATQLPIVGMGGVATGQDALEFVACGALHVALGTVLFGDPTAPSRVRDELAVVQMDDTYAVAHTPGKSLELSAKAVA
jgi:dihydroorotate dehydrogenase (NAD+) catalytic subunit